MDISDHFATESTCFISDVPWPGVDVNDDLFCTVCPASSHFDRDRPIGAADQGVVEQGVFQVTVWSRLSLDRLEHSAVAMTQAHRGLLKLKQRVLKALAGQQLYSDPPINTVPLLIEHLRPTQSVHPLSRQVNADYSSFSLIFDAPFYWDLT